MLVSFLPVQAVKRGKPNAGALLQPASLIHYFNTLSLIYLKFRV